MIKRRPSLSASHGGTVSEIEVEPGRMKKITTYCRFYQTHPIKRSIICLGYLDYPPCPDLERCRKNPRPRVVNYEDYAPSED